MKMAQISKWFCAIADAWADGKADWAYPNGKSLAVVVWNRMWLETGSYDEADLAIIELALNMNVFPKKKKKR